MPRGAESPRGRLLLLALFACGCHQLTAFLPAQQTEVRAWGHHRQGLGCSRVAGCSSGSRSSHRACPGSGVAISRAAKASAEEHRAAEGTASSAALPPAVVIVPGYASDAGQYKRLQESLLRRGVPTWVVPLKWYMWAPTFGGRSIRPILDRLHDTVLSVALQARPLPPQDSEQAAGVTGYGLEDFVNEMRDPSQGARPDVCAGFPPSDAWLGGEGARRYRVSLVGHSAGGWVSRLYLSEARYHGMVYNGSRLVDTLVTLGSPHEFPSRLANADTVPYALRSLKFVDEQCRGWEPRVRCLCVGSDSVTGGAVLGGRVKDMASSSYELCGYDSGLGVVGDGITPLESALGLPGASTLTLQGVLHGPEVEDQGRLWYGSDPGPLDQWLPFITQQQEAAAVAPQQQQYQQQPSVASSSSVRDF